MDRRSFIQSLSATVAASTLPVNAIAAGTGPKMKITDIRARKIKVIKDLGTVALRNGLGSMSGRGGDEARITVGGEAFIEILTDQGLSGIGPGVSPMMLARAKHLLVGQDPLLIEQHAYNLFDGGGSGGASVEIALWDLVGKATGQPLWRLWGGEHDTLMPYASQHSVGTPEERARMAERVAHDGWRAIKFRTHFETLKEDVALVEHTRKAMGPDFHIMCDANQAGNYPDGWGGGNVRWDLTRALQTAREYDRLGVFWLEEPMPRWAFEELAEITASVPMMIAGGEGSRGLHEWRWMLEQKVFDIMQFEVTIIGPTIARQISQLAAARDKYCVGHVSNGLGQICSGHLAASWSNAPRLSDVYPTGPTWEIFYEPPAADIFQMWEVYQNPPVMDKATGTIRLSDAPGLGVAYKPDLIQDA
jgi:D-galactarolactone cycloisomerase